MIEIGARHWFLALGTALAAHASVLALLHEPPSAEVGATGFGGIEVSLGTASGAPDLVKASAARPSETGTGPPTETPREPPPEMATATPPEPAQLAPMPTERVGISEAVPVEIDTIGAVHSPEEPAVAAPPEGVATANAAEAQPARQVPDESARTAPPEAVQTVRDPAGVESGPPDEVSSTPPADPVAANSPEIALSTTISAEPSHPSVASETVRAVSAESSELASAVRIARSLRPTTALAVLDAVGAAAEDSEVVREAPSAEKVLARSPTELVSAPPFDEATARTTAAPSTVRSADAATGPSAGNDAAGDSGVSGSATQRAETAYYARVRDWLEKHKRYPRRAKLRNEEGVVLLRLAVTREGDVTAFEIEESSGHSTLDEEAGKMVLRAQPLPRIPPEMRESRIELLVPLRFSLR